MTEQLAGFPHWEVRFDDRGVVVDPAAADAMLAELPAAGVTDLIVLSHGWNNDKPIARGLYRRFFEQVRAVLDGVDPQRRREAVIGTVGVLWPSMRWPDEDLGDDAGGAASLATPAGDAGLVGALKGVYDDGEQQAALDELARLLDERPSDPAALARFQQLLGVVSQGPDVTDAAEDTGERSLVESPPEEVFGRFADEVDAVAPPDDEGGAAGLGDAFGRLWRGAKEALRQATYWRMKKRAGVVGKDGLGPLLARFAEGVPGLRVHLVGHSFGARLVSFSLAGLPESALRPASPVKSVLLLQGAFSHFAFARELPHDRSRSGAVAGMTARVDGPLAVSHSRFDSAVGTFYPLASVVSGEDAAGFAERMYRWGAIGSDGAQASDATTADLGPVGAPYDLAAGRIVNLDANRVITAGGPPSGAHSDIFHPEVAWASLAVAGLVTRG